MTKPELEEKVKELEASINLLQTELKSSEEERLRIAELNRQLMEAAEEAKESGGVPSDNPSLTTGETGLNTGPEFNPILLASCVGVLRDRLSGGTLTDNEFQQQAPMFVAQARDLYKLLTQPE